MTSQEQKGGMGSTNLQVGQVTVGMTYRDVKDIAIDVYHQNAAKLQGDAIKAAEDRITQLADELAQKLAGSLSENLAGFAHPEKQMAILDAQKAYAVSGDENLRHMLVDSIVRLSVEPERSLRAVVLSEAIKVMPVLTPNQLAILSICFLMRSVGYPNATAATISAIVQRALGFDFTGMQLTDSDFRHIDFSRAAKVEVLELSLGRALCHQQGLPQDESNEANAIAQFSTTPAGSYIAQTWDSTEMKNLALTSVGIAIAHTAVGRREPLPDLSIWIK